MYVCVCVFTINIIYRIILTLKQIHSSRNTLTASLILIHFMVPIIHGI